MMNVRTISLPIKLWKRLRHRGGKRLIGFLSQIVQINEQPIFVLGNQKSGTTVIAALLARHAGLSATLDMRYPSARLLTKVATGEWTFEQFVQQRAYYFSRDLVKEPGLTFLYPELADRFPRSQFVMVMRDPRDNIRSLLNRLKIPGHHKQVPPALLREVNLVWQDILNGTAIGRRGDNYIETLALRWNAAAETYLNHQEQIQLVRYEDFCANKVKAIAHLAQELDLAAVRNISDEVDVQYARRGDRDVSWQEFYGQENLMRIEKLCKPNMEMLGYRVRSGAS